MEKIEKPEDLKQILTEILCHIDAFCKEYEIKYFLCGGTALGAVRHHGFIPWDDDIDIMMPREDYERFISLYREKDDSYYQLHTYENDQKYLFPYAKVDDSRTIVLERINRPSSIGVNLDVFPIDNLPEEEQKRNVLYQKASYLIKIYNIKQVKINRNRFFVKNIILLIGHLILAPISMDLIVKTLSNLPKRYKDQDSSLCGLVVWGYGKREINLKSSYKSQIFCEFEGFLFPIPVGYDDYLKSLYGDYMKLPPKERQISHHSFDAFWK